MSRQVLLCTFRPVLVTFLRVHGTVKLFYGTFLDAEYIYNLHLPFTPSPPTALARPRPPNVRHIAS